MLNTKLLKYGLLSVLILCLYGYHTYDKKEAVKAAKGQIEAIYDKKLLDASETARKKEHELQEQADNLRKEKDNAIGNLNVRLSDALAELHKRPKRPSVITETTYIRESCTGAELYREDAEFLTREAYRAERVLAERDYYYKQYEEIRKKYGS